MKRASFAARRKAVGFSQDQLAERLKIDRSTVVRWESGETEPQPWLRPRIAKALQVSPEVLGKLLSERSDSRSEAEAAATSLAQAAYRELPGRSAHMPLNETDIAVVRGMVGALTTADHQFGGGFARRTADSFLREVIQPRLDAPGSANVIRPFKAVVAELQMRISWMHLDVADSTAARTTAREGFKLAQESEDLPLCSLLMAMSALLETWLGSTTAAAGFGQAAVGLAVDGPHLLQAFAYGKLARALATAGNRDGALAGLAKARALFETASPGEDERVPSIILHGYSAAYLLDEEAHCYRDLGMDARALELSEQCLSLRGADQFTRNRAFATSNRALSLARLGEVDEACDSTLALLELAVSLQSDRVAKRLDAVLTELLPFRSTPVVRDLIGQVNESGIRPTIRR